MINPSKNRQLKQLNTIRFILPLILFLIVASYEVWEHLVLVGEYYFDFHLTSEILFFGILGPSAVFVVLTFVIRLLGKEIAISSELETLNRNLEKIVSERTETLEMRNKELADANSKLKNLDRLKSDFVSLVSHELRGPLTTLNGGLELALQDKDQLPEKSQKILEVMSHESQRLTRFVQTILDVSRLEAGKFNFTRGPVAVSPMLRRVVELNCECDDRELVWKVPEDLPPVWADEIYLEKVVANLLNNAVKYSQPTKPIELRAEMVDSKLIITVTDQGEGIPHAEQTQIFERFNRLEHGDVITTKGWGLGLYFAKALTEALNGQISVKSPIFDDPKFPGSAFTLILPLTSEVPEDG